MNRDICRILVAGEGGQGVQAIAQVLARTAFYGGLHVAYMPNYGVEQRGGVSLAFLQIGTGVIGFSKFSQADIILNMRARAIDRVDQYIGNETLYIYDCDLITGHELAHVMAEKLAIPATSLATKKLEPKVFNMILAGALASEVADLDTKHLAKALDEVFGGKYVKKPELKHLNKKAMEMGGKLAQEAYASRS